ncbi:MAG: tRNA (adenosine(37)-N6)-threonylcarbamoyltransferase complex ATPase subunit type 1 TsaE [Planctomycetia bacterium]
MPWTFNSFNPADTARAAAALAPLVEPGLVVGLVGTLGAGKTTFTRELAAALGVPADAVSSPTFILIHEYVGRLPVTHFDSYRLPDPDAFGDLGIEEYFFGDGVCLVEWADRVERFLPDDRLEIAFAVSGETTRRLTVRAVGGRWRRLAEEWRSAVGGDPSDAAIDQLP